MLAVKFTAVIRPSDYRQEVDAETVELTMEANGWALWHSVPEGPCAGSEHHLVWFEVRPYGTPEVELFPMIERAVRYADEKRAQAKAEDEAGIKPKWQRDRCPHGEPVGECNACDIAGDFAADAAREVRFFGR